MKNKREINVSDIITSEKIGGAEKALRVDSIREDEGVKKYYITAEGVQGTHVVTDEEVVDHATAEEYAQHLADVKNDSFDDEEEGNDTAAVTTVGTESKDPSTSSEEGNESSNTSTSDVTEQHTSETTPVAPVQQQKNHQQGKNNNNKRRV